MRKLPFCLSIILFSLAITSVGATTPKHIHLTWQDDPSTSITISWRTNSTMPSIVEYGLDSSYGMTASSTSGILHHVKLGDLQPATRYHYRCGSEEGWSRDYTFFTGSANLSSEITFVALGDSRSNMHTWARVLTAANSVEPDFIIHSGDLIDSGYSQKQWNFWFDRTTSVFPELVFMPSIGNHESNAREYFEQFALPDAEQWYSFDYGNAHFVALTTCSPVTGAQLEWLEDDLSSTNAMWKFLYYHHPMYSVGSHGPTPWVRDAWEEVLDKYQVDVIFNGHDHLYARTLPISNGEVVNSTDLGTVHVVTGGAGAPLHGVEDPGYEWLAHAQSVNHYVLVTVDGPNLKMEAITPDNVVIDSLEIEKTLYPDLSISGASLQPDIPEPYSQTSISVEVQNKGHVTVAEATVQLVVNGQLTGSRNLQQLNPGETSTTDFEWNTLGEGQYNLTVSVDPLDSVGEGRFETNNDMFIDALVSGPKSDLVPLSIVPIGGELSSGKDTVIRASIGNEGTIGTGSFEILFSGGGLNLNLQQSSISAGENLSFELPPVQFTEGDWEIRLEIDPLNKVVEYYEDNNLLTVDVPIRNFVKDGAAYYPKGSIEGDVLVIKYDDLEGAIPNGSDACTLLWGINDWSNPSLKPTGSIWSAGMTESPMERGLDGLWQIRVPTDTGVDMVNFMFRNGQLIGEVFDDNLGQTWIIYMRGWAEKAIGDLEQKISEAQAHGLDTSRFEEILRDAKEFLSSNDYKLAVDTIGNATGTVERNMLLHIYELVLSSYNEAVQEGLSIPRAEVFLFAAREAIDVENFSGSKAYLDTVIRLVEEARAKVDERILAPMILLIIPLRKVIR
jgi:hypothetical protein